jgi:hypothetical protein
LRFRSHPAILGVRELFGASLTRESRYFSSRLLSKSATRGLDGEAVPPSERRDEVMPESGRHFEVRALTGIP